MVQTLLKVLNKEKVGQGLRTANPNRNKHLCQSPVRVWKLGSALIL